jgi:protein-S-isoprenylcysteine O-methyltransferase Ste14
MLSRNPVSLLIIAVYLVGLIYLFQSGPVEPQSFLVGLLYGAGITLGLWAIWTLRTTTWRITPEVANGAILIENGPYTYLRHPMYLAVLLVALGLLLNDVTLLRTIALLVIFGALLLKIHYEETHLHRSFSRYKDYMQKTKKLIPFVY